MLWKQAGTPNIKLGMRYPLPPLNGSIKYVLTYLLHKSKISTSLLFFEMEK